MPVNGMNIGTDYSVSYFDSNNGQLIEFGDIQQVKITAMKADISSHTYNGPSRYGYIYKGYKIEFTVTRTLESIEDFFMDIEASQFTGAVQSPGTFQEVVNNSDGTQSSYQYNNFVVFMTDHGNIEQDKIVTLKIEGMASQKIPLNN
jgi:hypothetical protein